MLNSTPVGSEWNSRQVNDVLQNMQLLTFDTVVFITVVMFITVVRFITLPCL